MYETVRISRYPDIFVVKDRYLNDPSSQHHVYTYTGIESILVGTLN